MASNRRVAITGLGAVSPLGEGVDALWQGLLAGKSPAAPIALFDSARYRVNLACAVADTATTRDCNRAMLFALRAADEAVGSACLSRSDLGGCGIALASTSAGWQQSKAIYDQHLSGDGAALQRLAQAPALVLKEGPAAAVAARLELGGPAAISASACAAASEAIGWAASQIMDGNAAVMLAGGTDELTELVYAGFHSMRLLAPDACRPFSKGRRGLVLSEGAAFLVLEDAQHAAKRGARVLAYLEGYGASCDAAHVTTPNGVGLARAMTAALRSAGWQASEVDYVSAHATGSPANDLAEAAALRDVLGDWTESVPVGAIKAILGHTEGAAGAFAAIATVMTIQTGWIPSVAGFVEQDPQLPRLRLSTHGPEHHPVHRALINASGFGGANVSLALSSATQPERPQPRFVQHRSTSANLHNAPVVTAHAASRLDNRTQATGLDKATLQRIGVTQVDPAVAATTALMTNVLRLAGLPSAELASAEIGVSLGTFYGMQSCHERIAQALFTAGPLRVVPNDFAASTFNMPGALPAALLQLAGPNSVWLSPSGGAQAIGHASALLRHERVKAMVCGGFDHPSPFLQACVDACTDAKPLCGGIGLVLLEHPEVARARGATAHCSLTGAVSLVPRLTWPSSDDVQLVLRRLLAGLERSLDDVGVVVIDPHLSIRTAQIQAIDGLFGDTAHAPTMIDAHPTQGNPMAAHAALAIQHVLAAASKGRFPSEGVLRGGPVHDPDKLTLILSAGYCSPLVALAVLTSCLPHSQQ